VFLCYVSLSEVKSTSTFNFRTIDDQICNTYFFLPTVTNYFCLDKINYYESNEIISNKLPYVSRSFILIQNYFAFSLLFRLIDLFHSHHFLCLGEAIYCNLRCNIGAVHYTYVFIIHERYHYHCLILMQ